jgi:hypothetical protein
MRVLRRPSIPEYRALVAVLTPLPPIDWYEDYHHRKGYGSGTLFNSFTGHYREPGCAGSLR